MEVNELQIKDKITVIINDAEFYWGTVTEITDTVIKLATRFGKVGFIKKDITFLTVQGP